MKIAFEILQKVSSKNKISKIGHKVISLLGSTNFCEQFFSIMKCYKSKSRNKISDAHLRDTLHLAISSMESNIATTLQLKQFHKSRCKHVAKQRK